MYATFSLLSPGALALRTAARTTIPTFFFARHLAAASKVLAERIVTKRNSFSSKSFSFLTAIEVKFEAVFAIPGNGAAYSSFLLVLQQDVISRHKLTYE